MKLLFVTQKVDKNDDLLGVYHEWIKGLARRFEHVSVICLYEGASELPSNVSVYSLGKEKGEKAFFQRLLYIFRFYKYLLAFRGKYDTVVVHMNKEYVVLGGIFWKMARIPVAFWYNHPQADWMARWAFSLSDIIFHTSPFAAPAKLSRALRMPVGVIVPESLPPSHERKGKILSVGRISKVKKSVLILQAVEKLSIPFSLDMVGSPVDREEDRSYFKKVEELAASLGERVRLHPAVPNAQVSDLFRGADLSLNFTETGSMDKTIFESMASGCPVITSNPAVRDMLPEQWKSLLFVDSKDPGAIAQKIEGVLGLGDEEYASLRRDLSEISKKESLERLVEKLASSVSQA